ncbi:hypothetical protein F0562_033924 [Nyssa sinensis]|uniref:FBD domain-containing protein n=1 Tax=Nyssa sinensis TaxID=561372 RepID=A0A5J5AIK6_9ASTE|nr:hypothetical protein F0562_033924 [Nyssa sinensis]
MQKQISRATMSENHKRKAARNGEDIISNLPRFLIDSILERMPIRDAARTCILSRKWSPSLTDVRVALCRKVEHSKHGESFNLVEFLGNLPKIVRLCCDGFFLKFLAAGSSDNAMEPILNYLEAPDCMDQTLDHLQTVQIGSMKGLKAELFFIKLILAHSPLLEMMFVEYSGEIDTNEGFRISRELMRFSRASPKAEIIYLDSNTS